MTSDSLDFGLDMARVLSPLALPPLYILRHGETEWNVEGRMQGRLDSDLTARGKAQAADQARIMAPFLDGGGFSIYSSPLGRAAHTARIALAGYEIAFDPRISEISVGSWEGRLRREIIAECAPAEALSPSEADRFALYLMAPDGERVEAVEARCLAFLAGLCGPSVIVTHSITAAVLRGIACGLSLRELLALSHEQGCVFYIEGGVERILRAPG
ncbi:MAG: histidine phosphatase family protein [Paracoccaceae bacterium]